ncbi:Gfo/Idh/MocA family oxidoreductase [Rathayibacter iranicus]|uniref:Oxidoreductase n=2 Tax=Rathayibacter iranicus TaxID=59737 RepID=A0AAD1ABY9_9MICO|nr:Gfo/Idh/MocA family oxidoreductase [Rathayibacter iranicus]AZZ55448.1 oxidoreductase [Rathayibacter iranicus]MWV31732.1 oxidoreductase [Rathayibacter iranicus NCPPB 2253 = VKM Ac-1602]PPI60868.1 oxidoreductase [Rathayibacter iranicus]PPI72604.1 oxidoreductase [Rathayibacter iranicus]PWJ63309.1 putative dehydrogenase [Rathayibacter iranicus] [Rathayibacter iranicus NCPPB 2253 = VKM Ac-1602]
MIRVGLVGFGLAGSVFHGPFLAADPAFEIVAIATRDAARSEAASAAHPGARIVPDLDAVLAERPALVVLATPPSVHRAQAEQVLAAGVAVVIDKPFAPSTADADAIIAASEASGAPVFVFQNRRWDSDLLTLRRLLAEGALGQVLRFESSFERWSAQKTGRWQSEIGVPEGGGILFDLGSHLIDQALLLFGPARVTAAETRVVHPGGASEDEAFVSLLHRGGVRSHLAMSRVARATGPRLRVLGTRGGYSVDGLDPQEMALRTGAHAEDPRFGEVPAESWGVLVDDDGARRVPSERGRYSAFLEQVARALLDGAPAPVDVHEARDVVAVIEQAHALAAQ